MPKGDAPGEHYSPTQPFPTRPPAYDRQGFAVDDLIDFTPELRKEGEAAIALYRIGPMFTPPSVSKKEGPIATLMMAAQGAATNWPGGSFDPETGILYVASQSSPAAMGLVPPAPGVSDLPYHQGTVLTGARQSGGSGSATAEAGGAVRALSVQGLPLVKPPYSRISAIDLTKGEIRWQVPHGATPDLVKNHPALKGIDLPPTGRPGNNVGTLVTRTPAHRRRRQLRADAVGDARRDAARLRQGQRQGAGRVPVAGAADRLADDLLTERAAVPGDRGERSRLQRRTAGPARAATDAATLGAPMSIRKAAAVVSLSLCTVAALRAAPDRFPAAGGDLVITPLIHSSMQIEHAGLVIQIDPWSKAGLARMKPADLIVITDDVGHHLDGAAIKAVRKPGAPVVIAANGKGVVPDGIVLANGESREVAGVRVEAVGAYDVTPGESFHPKGEANGYVLTIGGKRIYLAGVTECVPEVRAVRNIDIAFFPMNVPAERMEPAEAVECLSRHPAQGRLSLPLRSGVGAPARPRRHPPGGHDPRPPDPEGRPGGARRRGPRGRLVSPAVGSAVAWQPHFVATSVDV